MSFTVYKYPFSIADEFEIEMPRNAEVLHVTEQHGVPCIWAFVEPTAPMVKRLFRCAGTGHPIRFPGRHVSTFFQEGGALVWHLFDYGEER